MPLETQRSKFGGFSKNSSPWSVAAKSTQFALQTVCTQEAYDFVHGVNGNSVIAFPCRKLNGVEFRITSSSGRRKGNSGGQNDKHKRIIYGAHFNVMISYFTQSHRRTPVGSRVARLALLTEAALPESCGLQICEPPNLQKTFGGT